MTPDLKMAISRQSFFSLFTGAPEAAARTKSMKRAETSAMGSPWARTPALKSIQWLFFSKRGVLVDIFIVGTKVPNGVPRPVVNRTIWQPHDARAVEATRSLPGALRRFKPLTLKRSPYFKTPRTMLFPHFCVQPRDFSSSVEIPPALLPGEGF